MGYLWLPGDIICRFAHLDKQISAVIIFLLKFIYPFIALFLLGLHGSCFLEIVFIAKLVCSLQLQKIEESVRLNFYDVVENIIVSRRIVMRKVGTVLAFMLLCLMVSNPASSATLTGLAISGPSSIEGGKSASYTATTTYGSGSPVAITPSLWYVTPPTYASISTSGAVTTKAVTSQQTITVYASYTEGGVSKNNTVSVKINPSSTANSTSAPTLTAIAINGAGSIAGGKSETYTATATYSNGTTAKVTPSFWYVTPPTYASVSTSGAVTANAVTAQQTIIVYGRYTEGGVTQAGTMTVSITPSSATSSLSCASGSLYKAELSNGSTGSMCLSMKKVTAPSGESKLRGTASWSGFATSAGSATGSTFTFAWENYESDSAAGTLYENNPAQGALFVLAYAFPSGSCAGGASFYAVIETRSAVSLSDLGSSLSFTPLFGQICGTKITTLTQYTLTKQF
jgi:hypothetical protein